MAFDVITPVKLGAGEIPVTATVFRTTPAASRDIVKAINVANSTGLTATVTLWLVPDGDVAGVDNLLLPTVPVNSNTLFQWAGTIVLDAGATIVAQASTLGLGIQISGGNAV